MITKVKELINVGSLTFTHHVTDGELFFEIEDNTSVCVSIDDAKEIISFLSEFVDNRGE